jgi:hypothetical protein
MITLIYIWTNARFEVLQWLFIIKVYIYPELIILWVLSSVNNMLCRFFILFVSFRLKRSWCHHFPTGVVFVLFWFLGFVFQSFVLLYSDCPLTLKCPRIWKMSIDPMKYYFYVIAQISICLHKYIPYVEYLYINYIFKHYIVIWSIQV